LIATFFRLISAATRGGIMRHYMHWNHRRGRNCWFFKGKGPMAAFILELRATSCRSFRSGASGLREHREFLKKGRERQSSV